MEQAVIYSPVGPLTLFAEDDFLTALVYGDYGGYDDIPLFREARRQLDEYFDGQRQAFHLPLRPEQKFPSLAAMQAEIRRNAQQAEAYFAAQEKK